MKKRITAEWLREKEACEDQVEKFEQLWPNGADLTLSNLLIAAEAGLDTYFLEILLTKKEQREFDNLCVSLPSECPYEIIVDNEVFPAGDCEPIKNGYCAAIDLWNILKRK